MEKCVSANGIRISCMFDDLPVLTHVSDLHQFQAWRLYLATLSSDRTRFYCAIGYRVLVTRWMARVLGIENVWKRDWRREYGE